MGPPFALALIVIVIAALVWVNQAAANEEIVNDGRDTSGALDIESVAQAHWGPDAIVARLTTWNRFGARTLSGANAISFAFYKSGYPFRWLYVTRHGRRLEAVMERDRGGVVGEATLTRPNRRTVVIRVPTTFLGQPAGYRWAAFTAFRNAAACSRTCFDAVPSSLQYEKTGASVVHPRLHDLTAPKIRLIDFPDPSTLRSAGLTYPVRFAVRDTGGAGLHRWRLERRSVSATAWAVPAQGPKQGRKRVRLRGREGATYEQRVLAVDRQGNSRRSAVRFVSVPFDDANAALLPGYAGAWQTNASTARDFNGTLHTSSDPSAAFTYKFTGTRVALIGPGEAGTARVGVDAAPPVDVDLSAFAGHRKVLFAERLPAGEHALSVTVADGLVGIDGIAVRNGEPASSLRANEVFRSEEDVLGTEARTSLQDDDGVDCSLPVLLDALCAEGVERPLSRGYADAWYGWPVSPVHKQHPIRGSFLDPRPGGLHFGVDINVRDDRPEAGAPPGRTHRVYAVEGGTVFNLFDGSGMPCSERRLWIGHFAYYHVDATVAAGTSVSPGQMIGWTCKGLWHVHLSEFAAGGVLVNPLHPGGKLRPYSDTKPPEVHRFAYYKPAADLWTVPRGSMWSPAGVDQVSPGSLSGFVDVRVLVSDPQSFRGWLSSLPFLYADFHPYRVSLSVVRVSHGAKVLRREISGPYFPYALPHNNHFAPGTRANQRAETCYKLHRRRSGDPVSCAGRYWLHAFGTASSPYWNTRSVSDGRYRLRITAWDALGNRASRNVDVTVKNGQ